MQQKNPLLIKATCWVILIVFGIYGLVAARNFLYPLCLSFLLAFLLLPIASFLEYKCGFARILANLVSIILGLLTIGSLIYVVSIQMSVFVDDLPQLRSKALENVNHVILEIQDIFGVSPEAQEKWLKERVVGMFETGGEFFRTAFSATTGTITKAGLMPVYVFFVLYYRDKFYSFLFKIVPHGKHHKTKSIVSEVSGIVQNYVVGVFVVVLILCGLNSLGLYIVGLKYPVLLGVIAALFNFIPYFGTLLGGILPLLFAILMHSSPNLVAGVVIHFLIVQFLENNILTPNIVGNNVRLSPFFVILSIIVGAMVWGIPGMVLIVPFIAVFKVFCEHMENLRPFAYLLGTEGTEEHSVTWEKIKGVFRKGG